MGKFVGKNSRLVTSHCGQPHSAQQVGVARVGAHPMPEWVNTQINQSGRALLISFFQPVE